MLRRACSVAPADGIDNPAAKPQRRRIALYSHDTMGLGRTRRNMLIAHRLATASTPADILLVTGAAETNAFALPPAVDVLSLPALQKDEDGRYRARRLDLSLHDLSSLRAATIKAALLSFAPDLLIVDNVPRGAARELDPALTALRDAGHTRIVLGLRDILDEPDVVVHEWERAENFQALRDFYDAIWVYGDPRVFNPASAYRFPIDVSSMVSYTGYLDGRLRPHVFDAESKAVIDRLDLPPGRLALCMVGGGQDGANVVSSFAQAQLPHDMNAIVVTGPHMPDVAKQHLRLLAAGNPKLRVLDFLPEPTLLLDRADCVIAMGGYNTICELLAFDKRALIVPRVTPRREQLIRAERLCGLGLVDVLHPDAVTPGAITEWLAAESRSTANARELLDLDGLDRLPDLLEELLAAPEPVAWTLDVTTRGQYVHVA